MKTKFSLLICLSALLFQCATEEQTKSPIWGVDFSTESATIQAEGAIERENAGPSVMYIVNSAYLRQADDDLYNISSTFENGESIQLVVTKKTADCNYHYPGTESENQLISAIFNGVALNLAESSIAVQPHLEENKLHIITDMHTLNAGDFNGTLSRVPLVK
jgi:hypothetical protein